MKKLMVVMMVLVMTLTGCGLLSSIVKPTEDVAQNLTIVQNVTETTVLLVLKDKDKTVAEIMLKEINDFVMPMLNDSEVKITNAAEEILFAKLEKIDDDYKALMTVAFMVLNEFYESPSVGKILSDDGVKYLTAFFTGIKNACELEVQ